MLLMAVPQLQLLLAAVWVEYLVWRTDADEIAVERGHEEKPSPELLQEKKRLVKI